MTSNYLNHAWKVILVLRPLKMVSLGKQITEIGLFWSNNSCLCIITTSIDNLNNNNKKSDLCISLMSSSIGYVLLSPGGARLDIKEPNTNQG